MKVFLDDERATPPGWIRTYLPEETIALLKTGLVTELSLDHDLGNDLRGTGYDVVLWVEQAVALHGFAPPRMRVHSANAPARAKMEAGIQAIQRLQASLPQAAHRQQQISTLLTLLAEHWRQSPDLQLDELLEALIPSGVMCLDGPDRDDESLINVLRRPPLSKGVVTPSC